MKIVYLTNKPIFPLIDGGCVAMNQFLKSLLLAGYDVKNFSVSTFKHPFKLEKFPKNLINSIRPQGIEIDSKIKFLSAFTYLFKKGSYNIDRFTSSNFKNELQSYLTTYKVDLVIIESVYLIGYLPTIRNFSSCKVIIRSHNVEYLIWERLANNQSSFLKKIYYKKLARDLKKVELKSLQLINGIAAISKKDQLIFESNGIKSPLTTIPVSIEKSNLIADYSINTFYHVGSMNWQPNIESVKWLISSIFPKIKHKIPDAKLIIAGSFMPTDLIPPDSKDIEVIGFVDDLSSFIVNNGIMIAPLKSGSGVRIKILEAMNFGAPIISSSIGMEGIDAIDRKDFYCANNEDEFVESAVALYYSKQTRENIGQNAKILVEENYQTEIITKKIIEFINNIS